MTTPDEAALAKWKAREAIRRDPMWGHGALGHPEGSAGGGGVLDIIGHLPPIPRITSVWFQQEDTTATWGINWIRTAYCGTRLVRIAYGPDHAERGAPAARRHRGCYAAAVPGGTVDVFGNTHEAVFRGISDGLRAHGWLLPGPDVPAGWTAP